MKMSRFALLLAVLCAPLVLRAQVAGTLDAGFDPNASAVVFSLVPQPDGKIALSGGFSTVGGVARNRSARVNAGGTLDTGFNPNVTGNFLWSIAVLSDGRSIIAGEFTAVGGVARNYIAKVDANGVVDATFNPNANATVKCLAVQADGKIVIGGDFTTVGGVTRNRIARLNADGTLDTAFNPNLNGLVNTVLVQPDGLIVVGGGFTTVGGVTRNHIARLNADGTRDTSFVADVNTALFCAALQADGKIVIGGGFTTVNGTTRNGLARLTATGGLDGVFNPNVNNTVYSIALQADGRIVFGGTFVTVSATTRDHVARLNADGSLDTAFVAAANDFVYGTSVQADGRILLGGDFATVNGVARNHAARLTNDAPTQTLTVTATNRVQWLRGGAAPEAETVSFDVSTDGGANWTALGAGTRITGGWENTVLNLPASGTVRARARTRGGYVNGSTGLVEQTAAYALPIASVDGGFVFPLGGFPHGLAVQPDGKIAVANHASGSFPQYCFRVKTDGTLDQVFSPGANDLGMCAAIQADGKVLFGGEFTSPGYKFVRYLGTGTLDTAFSVTAGFAVHWTTPQPDGKILLGGNFNTINGVNRYKVARLNADGTLDPAFPNPNALAQAWSGVLQPDGKIVIGGNFDSVGGATRRRIARLNADGTVDPGFNPNANDPNASGSVYAVALQADGKIIVAGDFTAMAGVARNRIARLNADGTLDTGFNPNLDNLVQSTVVQADGKIIIGGWFTTVGGVARKSIARLNANGTLDTTFNVGAIDGVLVSAALQADGKIVMGGNFSNINGSVRGSFARLLNSPATQALTIASGSRVQWLRGGSSPETHAVTFELSTDGGNSWTPLGAGARITGGWERTGLSLPANGAIRARARTAGGYFNGSSGLVEQTQTFAIDIVPPTLSPVTITSNNPNPLYAKLGDTITLTFTASEPIQAPIVTIAGQSVTASNSGGNNWQGALTVGAATPLGTAAISIAATDLAGNTASAVTATTNGSSVIVDNPPLARVATLGAVGGSASRLSVAKLHAYGSDPDGDAFTIIAVSPASAQGGTVTLLAGLITYTPPAGYSGPDSFTYTLRDALGFTSTGMVNVTVAAAPAASLNVVSITHTADGYLVRFAGIPGVSYVIQYRDTLNDPWQTLAPPGPIPAGPNGLFEYEDKPAPVPASRFYRAAEAP